MTRSTQGCSRQVTPASLSRSLTRMCRMLPCLLCLLLCSAPCLGDTILLLNSFSSDSNWARGITAGVRTELRRHLSNPVLVVEYMNSEQHADADEERDVRGELARIYPQGAVNLLITADDEAYQFALAHREKLFGDIPMIFCGVNDFNPTQVQAARNITGVLQIPNVENTIELALRRRPDARRLAVIHDDTAAGKGYRNEIDRLADSIRTTHPDLQIVYLDGQQIATPELIEYVRSMPEDTVILFTAWAYGNDRNYVPYKTIFPLISRVSSVPVYGVTNFTPGLGSVGGTYQDGFKQGQAAAAMALRVLSGTLPGEIPIQPLPSAARQEDLSSELFADSAAAPRPGVLHRLAARTPLQRYWRMAPILTFAFLIQGLVIALLAWALLRLQHAERRLQSSRGQLNLIVESAKLGVFDWNIASSRVNTNAHYAEMLGYAPDELPPTIETWQELIHPEDRERVTKTLETYLEDQATYYQAEYRMRNKNGTYTWVLGRGEVAERDATGSPVRMTGVHVDIDERMRAQARLEKSRQSLRRLLRQKTQRLRQALKDSEAHADAARAASQEKAQLLARLAREFHDPITYLNRSLAKLQKTRLTPAQEKISQQAQQTCHAMASMTEDMLELYSLETGKVFLEPVAFDLRKCLQDVVRTLYPPARDKGLDLLLRHPPAVPHMVRGDRERLKQILSHLLGRTIATSENGHVLLSVAATPATGNAQRFVISIQSRGRQRRNADCLPDTLPTRWPARCRFDRTGVGLSITRAVASLLQADLLLEQTSGSGTVSRLTLILPVLAPPLHDLPPPLVPPGTVLLLCDRRLPRRLLAEGLQQCGLPLLTSSDPEQVPALLQAARNDAPNSPLLLLADLRHEPLQQSLLHLAEQVRQTATSVLMLAALPAKSDTDALLAAGYTACLTEPVFPEDLVDVMADLLEPEKANALSGQS